MNLRGAWALIKHTWMMWLQQRSPGWRAVATANGVERDPGQRATSATPARASSSKKAALKACARLEASATAVLTLRSPAAGRAARAA